MNLQQPEPIHHREELAALAAYLQNYATAHNPPEPTFFQMNYWRSAVHRLDPLVQINLGLRSINAPPLTCGYAACAIGHLPYAWPATKLIIIEDKILGNVTYTVPGKTLTGFSAICEYFNITPSTASYLFGTETYLREQRHDPVYVGQRIQAFLDANPPPPIPN